jgi:hypothetical protein
MSKYQARLDASVCRPANYNLLGYKLQFGKLQTGVWIYSNYSKQLYSVEENLVDDSNYH